jgi:hypothetical protein
LYGSATFDTRVMQAASVSGRDETVAMRNWSRGAR